MPTQITSIDPSYTYCIPSFFTAFDPPHTLAPASALVAEPTASQVVPGIIAPSADTPLGVGNKQTKLWNEPTSAPDALPSATSPGSTKAPGLDPQKTQPFDHQDHPTPAPQGADPPSLDDTFGQQSSVTRDANPKFQASIIAEVEPTDTVSSDWGLQRASPDQMSRIASALALGPLNGPLVEPGVESSGFQPNKPVQSKLIPGWQAPSDSVAQEQHKSTQTFPWTSVPNLKAPVDGNAVIAPSVATTGHDDDDQVSGASRGRTTLMNGHAVQAVSGGVSVDGKTVIAEAAPIFISGTAISVDKLHNVYVEGTPYQIPTIGHAPMTTMMDGSVAVPLGNGFESLGTVSMTEVPANNVSPIQVSVDASSIQVTGGNDKNLSPASATSDPREMDDNTSATSQQQATPASAATVEKDTTLFRGAPAVTMHGVPVSLGSAGEIVKGSKTMALISSNGGLGGYIVGGLEGRPTSSADSASSTPQGSPTLGANGSPSDNPTTRSGAVCATSQLWWPTLIGSLAMFLLTTWV